MTYNLVEIYQLFLIFSQNQSDYLLELKTFGIGEYKLYRVSQEECARLREGVPYAKLY